ncbi:hypothetical protein FACS1894104_1580 [Actinomycetota bacterium]|nr:hypothetical protein FACS1894104_1580 [Actinomycetota bacterium]
MASENQDSKGSAFEQLCDMLVNIIGADAVEIIDIQPDSKFVVDLGMDSIQIVALIEQGKVRFGDKVDFLGWLATLSYLDLLNLTVGDVADFVEQSLKSKVEPKQ